MSLYIFMHLCIYARAWQLPWPWLDTDKEHTAAVDPSDSKRWPGQLVGGVPSWLPVEGADKLEGGSKGRRQRWSEGTDRRTVSDWGQRKSKDATALLSCFPLQLNVKH